MQFEERLNNLHALNRTFNANALKYKESSEEKQIHIDTLQLEMAELKQQLRDEQTASTTQSFKRGTAEDKILTKTNEVNVLKNLLEEVSAELGLASGENNTRRKEMNAQEKALKQKTDLLDETSKMHKAAAQNESELRLKCADLTIEVSKYRLDNEQLLDRAKDAYAARDLAKRAMEA